MSPQSKRTSKTSRPHRWLTRWRVRRAAIRKTPNGFVNQPEPRTIGEFAKGRQLVAGNFLFTGHLMEVGNGSPWEVDPPAESFAEALHGFVWMDDLAALGDVPARDRAQTWLRDWIGRFGGGQGPGWNPDTTGRRLIRWVNHGLFLVAASDKTHSDMYFRSLAQQTKFLSRFWHHTSPGLPRFEALVGVLYASLAIEGMAALTRPMVDALVQECRDEINADGGIPTRNPEELLEIFTLLNWAVQALQQEDRQVPTAIGQAIQAMAPILRAMRHSSGDLARYHGGGKGAPGRLDQALAASGIRAAAPMLNAMGYARMVAGSTTIMIDAAAPPTGAASYAAHASTCAMELSSGRLPVIVSCGSGVSFGDEWRLAGRATPSHSTLGIDGMSSSRFGIGDSRRLLTDVPTDVAMQRTDAIDGTRVQVGHNGYARTHGLTHARTLDVTLDGRGVAGEDMLFVREEKDRAQFKKYVEAHSHGPQFSVRFHIHPDVESALDMNGSAVSLTLKNGDVWVFRHDGTAKMSLEPSVYLEQGRVHPSAADQIVLAALADTDSTKVRWSLAKARENPVRGGDRG